MTKMLMGITDDGNVVIGRRILPRIGMIPIGCLTRTRIRRFGITRIVHFMDIADIIMVTMRRITVTIGVIILIETSIDGIIGVVADIHRFHGGLTKKAIYGLTIGVREVHAA
ncbi:hypothetical protein C6503_26785 [Candidatus Poribacteria bacterium]|nr:MAG: hypothetical protein C6503_26785 [Candidatus Poribacteria bacterium]